MQAGLALLICIVDANLVYAGYQTEVRERQQGWLEAGDWRDFEFRVVMTAVTNMDVKRAIDVIYDYLNWDDERVAPAAESLRVPEFEHLKPEVNQWWFSLSELLEYSTSYFESVVRFSCFRLLFTTRILSGSLRSRCLFYSDMLCC